MIICSSVIMANAPVVSRTHAQFHQSDIFCRYCSVARTSVVNINVRAREQQQKPLREGELGSGSGTVDICLCCYWGTKDGGEDAVVNWSRFMSASCARKAANQAYLLEQIVYTISLPHLWQWEIRVHAFSKPIDTCCYRYDLPMMW